jgi:hypothetical protein
MSKSGVLTRLCEVIRAVNCGGPVTLLRSNPDSPHQWTLFLAFNAMILYGSATLPP